MRLFDNTLSVLSHHFALITVTRGKVAFVDSEVGESDGYLAGMASSTRVKDAFVEGENDGNLAGMASSIAMMVSIGSLVALYVWAYHGTILSATSSLIGVVITIVQQCASSSV